LILIFKHLFDMIVWRQERRDEGIGHDAGEPA
jgi:hypothetical protein